MIGGGFPQSDPLLLPDRKAVFLLCLLLFAAAVLQSTVAGHLSFYGGQPDFLFTLTLCAALLSDAGIGSLVGFGGALLTAAIVGETVGTFLVARTVAGFVAGWFSSRMFRGNTLVIVVSVLFSSLLAEVIYILAAPRIGLSRWLHAALIGSAWNAVLAVPAAYVLKRCGWGRDRV